MKGKNPAMTDAQIRKALTALRPVFAHAAVGDFSHDVAVPEDAGPFEELFAGAQIMIDVIRKQLEELRESQEVTQGLLGSVGEGIVALDREGRVVFINDSAERLIGRTAARSMGRPWQTVISALEAEGGPAIEDEKRPYRVALQTKKRNTRVMTYMRRDKKRFPISITATPVFLHGKLWGVVQIFRDITKEIESQQAATEYVSLTAHQMRSSLTLIRWTAETLLSGDEGALTATQLEQVQALYDADLKMITLVGAFLNVSRLELGSFAVTPAPLDVRAALDAVASELALEAGRASVRFARAYDDAVPLIEADPKLLQVIFHNLVSNAVKYGRKGGEIRLGIETDRQEIVVSVADDGLGIPASEQSKIFIKLYRAENVRNQEIEGTGLGLYIVKTILEKTGGRIWFDSKEGKGTTFYVALPLRGMRAQSGSTGLTSAS